MPGRRNLAALSSIAPISFEGQVSRVVLQRHRDKLLSTEGNRYFDGRYHRAGETGILYTSQDIRVAMEEIKRHVPLEQLAEGLVEGSIKVKLTKVLDITQESILGELGLSKDILIGADYTPTQAVSLAARRLGFQGLIVPSATGLGDNLIIFEDNLGEGCLIAVEGIKPIS